MTQWRRDARPDMTLVVDPRFGGGTSSAVASEIRTLHRSCHLRVVFLTTKMFSGRSVNPALRAACLDAGIEPEWDPLVISARTVVFHNPACLKFNASLGSQIYSDRLIVVCHENFIRPNGAPSFDVNSCLGHLAASTICRARYLAPVSAWNRHGIEQWTFREPGRWQTLGTNWTNICDFDLLAPTPTPTDSRGRHSRAGFEKFPGTADLLSAFAGCSGSVRILGADSLASEDLPAEWELLPFGSEAVSEFLSSIDFFVYFTNPGWRESFGRAIAEAIAAGKVVITDPGTARNFADGVVAAAPTEVDGIIAEMIAEPQLYAAQVGKGQRFLQQFTPEEFRGRLSVIFDEIEQTLKNTLATEAIDALL